MSGDGNNATDRRILVDALVGEMRPSAYAYGVVALCGLIGMAEGYDAQTMAFAAPLVAKAWGLSPAMLGMLLAASIVAMVAGGFLLSPLGDRFGRRPAVLGALGLVSLATTAGAFAPDFGWMLASRALAGLGLGLAFPTVIALAMEVMPRRLHALAVVIVSCGYPVGGAVGGMSAAALVDVHGHAAVFVLGGAATAILWLLCLIGLPESPLWLARQSGAATRLAHLLPRLGAEAPEPGSTFGIGEPPVERSPVAELFTRERRSRTLLLWLINFANLFLAYFYVIWLPTILVNAGQTPGFAAKALGMYSFAAAGGGILLVFVLRRWGASRTLGGAYIGAGLLIGVLAILPVAGGAFMVALCCAGALIVGSQFCLNAVVNQYYGTAIRATASGYASGAGRLGAVAAPVIGSIVVHPATPASVAIGVGIVPAAIALLGLVTLVTTAPLEANK